MRDVLIQLGGFLAVSALVICTPGQDTALTIRSTLAGGRGGGLATAGGVAAGQAVWTIAAAAGLAALLTASQPAFVALRLAGAAYLVFLGGQALLAAVRGRGGTTHGAAGGGAARARVAFRQGLVSNLANPKMAVFFTSLLPQFAPAGDGAFAAMTALGLLFSTLTLLWLAAYAVAVARARDLLGRTGVRRALEAVTGAVLVALGLRVAASAR
ncbi:MAG TPA: LysE family translocator [Gaiellaceae bacterium]|nr:LysE family translocator [Gaiellaceae bacterium]